jgi:hypothetical protein
VGKLRRQFGEVVEDAVGVLIGDVLTLSEVIGRYFGGERPDEDTVKKLCGWRPSDPPAFGTDSAQSVSRETDPAIPVPRLPHLDRAEPRR